MADKDTGCGDPNPSINERLFEKFEKLIEDETEPTALCLLVNTYKLLVEAVNIKNTL